MRKDLKYSQSAIDRTRGQHLRFVVPINGSDDFGVPSADNVGNAIPFDVFNHNIEDILILLLCARTSLSEIHPRFGDRKVIIGAHAQQRHDSTLASLLLVGVRL